MTYWYGEPFQRIRNRAILIFDINMMEWLTSLIEGSYNKIFVSLGIILVLWIIRLLAQRIVFKKVDDVKDRYYWKRGIRYTTVTIGIVLIGFIWVSEVGSVATFFGLLSAGLTIALKDPIVNLAGWIFIILRRPFQVGDRVQIGEHAGDVIDVRIFQFTINEIGNWVDADQSTGRIVHIPNGVVFLQSQVNYNKGFSHIWNEIGVLVTFESNWQKAKKLLFEIVKPHGSQLTEKARKELMESSKNFMIFYKTLDPIVYTSVKDSGVMLTMRYLCEPRRRRGSENDVWEEVLTTFAQHDDIDFAYPTQRIYYNLKEGKDGTRKSEGS